METHETSKIPIEALYKVALIELGKANAHISEIEFLLKQYTFEIEQLKRLSDEEKKEVKRNEFYKKQNDRIHQLQLKLRDYKKTNIRYLNELTQYRIKKN